MNACFKKADRFSAGDPDIKKSKDGLAYFNLAIAAYALAIQEKICHLANLPSIVQLKGVEKSPSARSKQMRMMKIPSKMKTTATELPQLSQNCQCCH